MPARSAPSATDAPFGSLKSRSNCFGMLPLIDTDLLCWPLVSISAVEGRPEVRFRRPALSGCRVARRNFTSGRSQNRA